MQIGVALAALEIGMLTLVNRPTRCLLGWNVVRGHTKLAIQDMVDDAPKAKVYSSDALDAYGRLWHHFSRCGVS